MFPGQDRLECIINKMIFHAIEQHTPVSRNLVGVVKSALSCFSFRFHVLGVFNNSLLVKYLC